ncbi:RNA polymerase sigma factor [Crossiella cryophila]|uniref:RNA polymerase sigma-70 factor (ECF subfamily) n=1 Tax=Crossiella cryophila TaxID=43355 RepID=A0A7W7CAK4_9PSEU|nr:sigma-70 family RNA polymerase sigma factor [Crossiella cryophila]MBB4677593.1 RNA polymerase sigma-70 factor (ECF subfamily) [Crossiella cryophila]
MRNASPPAMSFSAADWGQCVRLRPELVRLATRRGAGDDAEDLVHEAFIRTAAHPDLDRSRLRPFLMTVVKRLCVDHLRRQSVANRIFDHPMLAPVTGAGVAEAVTDRMHAHWMLDQPDLLAEADRKVLMLLADGRSYREVGERLRISELAVEQAARAGRRRIRRKIGQVEPAER